MSLLCASFQQVVGCTCSLVFGAKEGPRRTSKLASLLTQLLGKVAEAMLMHAKACNLPMLHVIAACCSALYEEALGGLLVNMLLYRVCNI